MRINNIRCNNYMFLRNTAYALFLLGVPGLFAADISANENGQKFTSGMYETLMLAVDHDGSITGSYRESQGEGVVKTCAFYLKGKAVDGFAPISTWRTQTFTGELKRAGTEVVLKIEKALEHPGCGLVLLPEIVGGLSLTKTTDAKWLSLRIVKNDRAQLFSSPSLSKITKAYFIKNDVLGVLSVNGEW